VFYRILGGVGRTFITAGTLILLFVVYQLWGTAIHEARAQKELTREFDEVLAQTAALREPEPAEPTEPIPSTTVPASSGPCWFGSASNPAKPAATPAAAVPGATGDAPTTTTTVAATDGTGTAADRAPAWLPVEGEPVAKIEIPSIGIKRTVVEGDGDAQLKRGMGHLASSPLPGQEGNAAVAGHRTTYGQPLHNIDKVDPGDVICVQTVQGTFIYEVTGHEIVGPKDVRVLEDRGKNELTLIACHPKYSLAQRYILYAELVGQPTEALPGQEDVRRDAAEVREGDDLTTGTLDGLSGSSSARTPVILWFLACAAIWLATWLVQTWLRRRARATAGEHAKPTRQQRLLTWAPYLVGFPVFLVALYFFFENFSLLLPGNY